MKTAICLLLSIVGCLSSCFAGPEGVWGGKWDDKWPVFLDVTRGDKTNSYKLRYIWLEDDADTSFTKRRMTAKKTGAYFKADFLLFKISGDTAILYGSFSQPRMANLVKISNGVPSVAECNDVLKKHHWEAKAIPAAEARKKITKP